MFRCPWGLSGEISNTHKTPSSEETQGMGSLRETGPQKIKGNIEDLKILEFQEFVCEAEDS